jgi:hypothetical protein
VAVALGGVPVGSGDGVGGAGFGDSVGLGVDVDSARAAVADGKRGADDVADDVADDGVVSSSPEPPHAASRPPIATLRNPRRENVTGGTTGCD